MLLLWRQITVGSTCPPWAVMLECTENVRVCGFVCVSVCMRERETQNVYLSVDACLLLECMSSCICIIMCLLCLWMCDYVHVYVHLRNYLQVFWSSRMPAQLCPCINNLCLNVYALQMCLYVCVCGACACAPLIHQTEPEAPDGWPSIRLSRLPGKNTSGWGEYDALTLRCWRPGGLDFTPLLYPLSRKKILENPSAYSHANWITPNTWIQSGKNACRCWNWIEFIPTLSTQDKYSIWWRFSN